MRLFVDHKQLYYKNSINMSKYIDNNTAITVLTAQGKALLNIKF